MPLRRVGALAPVDAAASRLVRQPQASAGREHIGDKLLGLQRPVFPRLAGNERGRASGSSRTVAASSSGRWRWLLVQSVEDSATAVGQFSMPSRRSTADANEVTAAESGCADSVPVVLHDVVRAAKGDPVEHGDLCLVQIECELLDACPLASGVVSDGHGVHRPCKGLRAGHGRIVRVIP